MPPEPRTRFAPSPTGLLHLGHAFSALTAWDRAKALGGVCLLRIEDIDTPRCRPEFEAAINDDLRWLGLDWPEPVMRQSARMPAYRAALDRLAVAGLVYPCRCTRGDIRAALSAPHEGDGPPPYPGTCRGRDMAQAGPADAIRLHLDRVLDTLGPDLPGWQETGTDTPGPRRLDPHALHALGDPVLARRDIGTSYLLAVVVDDAAQGITEAVRGADLLAETPMQVLLAAALGLRARAFHHHRLIRDALGRRLAKRDDARSLQALRAEGATAQDIRAMLGMG